MRRLECWCVFSNTQRKAYCSLSGALSHIHLWSWLLFIDVIVLSRDVIGCCVYLLDRERREDFLSFFLRFWILTHSRNGGQVIPVALILIIPFSIKSQCSSKSLAFFFNAVCVFGIDCQGRYSVCIPWIPWISPLTSVLGDLITSGMLQYVTYHLALQSISMCVSSGYLSFPALHRRNVHTIANMLGQMS